MWGLLYGRSETPRRQRKCTISKTVVSRARRVSVPSARSRLTTAFSYGSVLPSFSSSSSSPFCVVYCFLSAGTMCHCFSPAVPILQTLGCTRATIDPTSTTPSTAPQRRPNFLRHSPFFSSSHPATHYCPGLGHALGRAHGSVSAGAGTVPQTATGTVPRIAREGTGATPRTAIAIETGTGTGTGPAAAVVVAAAEATAAATKRRMAGATEVKSARRWTVSARRV